MEQELQRILESDQFRTSNRSCRFLRHVVDKAFTGEWESLKERILGIELFGRTSSFDTDHDSVVRVAANDVRKRLKEYYRTRPDSRVRIELPSGLYIPEVQVRAVSIPAPLPEPAAPARAVRPPWAYLAAAAVAVLLAFVWLRAYRSPAARAARLVADTPPWSTFLKAGGAIDIVPADANLVFAKVRSKKDVPLQEYNDHSFRYAGDMTGALSAYINFIPLTTVADANLAGRISELAARAGVRAQVKACSRVDFSELKGDTPVVLLGSPTSNPWVQLLYDRVNFQIVHRFEDGFDICLNRHANPGEQATYVPVWKPKEFSEGYAIVTMVPNLSGKAPVLIIAGTSTEGTEAAGEFVSNLDRLSDSLRKLKIGERGPVHQLELLLKTTFVASASATDQILAYRVQ